MADTTPPINLNFDDLNIPAAPVAGPAINAEPEKKADDRLAKEDKIVEIKEEKVQTQNIASPTEPQLPPTTSLKEDQKIIEDLLATPAPAPTPAPATAFDLDNLIGTPPTTTVQTQNIASPEIPTMPPIMTMPTIPVPPIIQTPVVPHKKKGFMSLLIFLVLGGACAYVLTVMYPLEFQSLKSNVLSIIGQGETDTQTTDQWIDTMLENTWNIFLETGEDIVQTWFITSQPETWNLQSDSGFNAFQDLETILTGMDANPVQTDQQLTLLQKYADEGNAFFELGKKINDKIMIKYGSYMKKKSEELIQSIENKEEIDNEKVENYLAQFSGYLYKLTTLSYDSSGLSAPTMIQDIDRQTETPDQTGNLQP